MINRTLLLILMVWCGAKGADLLFVGNSIVNEYSAYTTNAATACVAELGGGLTFVKNGVDGTRVDNIVSRLKTEIDTGHYSKVFFEGGLNDIVWEYSYYKGTATNIQLNNTINGILEYYKKAKTICDAKNVELIVPEMTPWGYTGTASQNKDNQDAIKSFNYALRDWCINNNVKLARVYLYLAKSQTTADNLITAYSHADGGHLSPAGYTYYGTLLARASVPTIHKYTFGKDSAGYRENYKINQLRLHENATISGDSGTGSIAITSQGSIYTPVLCADQSKNIDKSFTATINTTGGTYKTYYRGASINFPVDTNTAWILVSNAFTCHHRFFQLKVLADSSCTITDISIVKNNDGAFKKKYEVTTTVSGSSLPTGAKTVIPLTLNHVLFGTSTNDAFTLMGNRVERLRVYDGTTKLKCYVLSNKTKADSQNVKILVQCNTTAGSDKTLTVKIDPTYSENNFDESILTDEKYILHSGLEIPKDRCLLQQPITYSNVTNFSFVNGKDGYGAQMLNPSYLSFPYISTLSDTPKVTFTMVLSKPFFNQLDVMTYTNYGATNLIHIKTENDSFKVQFTKNSATAYAVLPSRLFSNNTFYFLAVRFDGTFTNGNALTQNRGRLKIYLGNFTDTLKDMTDSITYTGNMPTKTPFLLDAAQPYRLGQASYAMDGILDEYRVMLDAPDQKVINLAYQSFLNNYSYTVKAMNAKSTGNNKTRIALDIGQ